MLPEAMKYIMNVLLSNLLNVLSTLPVEKNVPKQEICGVIEKLFLLRP